MSFTRRPPSLCPMRTMSRRAGSWPPGSSVATAVSSTFAEAHGRIEDRVPGLIVKNQNWYPLADAGSFCSSLNISAQRAGLDAVPCTKTIGIRPGRYGSSAPSCVGVRRRRSSPERKPASSDPTPRTRRACTPAPPWARPRGRSFAPRSPPSPCPRSRTVQACPACAALGVVPRGLRGGQERGGHLARAAGSRARTARRPRPSRRRPARRGRRGDTGSAAPSPPDWRSARSRRASGPAEAPAHDRRRCQSRQTAAGTCQPGFHARPSLDCPAAVSPRSTDHRHCGPGIVEPGRRPAGGNRKAYA